MTKSQRPQPASNTVRGLAPIELPSIMVIGSVGRGPTSLAAFDAALHAAGIGDFNLIILSSVIPGGRSVVVVDHLAAPPGACGDRLYVVRAEARSAEPGMTLAAGLGWLQGDDGRGVFVEHEILQPGGDGERLKCDVSAAIQASLRDLAARRGIAFDPRRAGSRIVAARVERQPACVLVVAVYQSEGWR